MDSSIEPVLGSQKIYRQMSNWILKARKTIHYVAWTCDFRSTPLSFAVEEEEEEEIILNFFEVLQEACSRNPKVHIYLTLVDNPIQPILWPKHVDLLKNHTQIHLNVISLQKDDPKTNTASSSLFFKSMNFFKQRFNTFYRKTLTGGQNTIVKTLYEHLSPSNQDLFQSYLVLDGKHLLFGGTDIYPTYAEHDFFSSASPEDDVPKWIDLSVKIKYADPSWCQQLVRNSENPLTFASQWSPPFCNSTLSFPYSEEDWLIKAISQAEESILIQHEFFFSTLTTQNRICQALIKKLKQRTSSLKIMVLTNWSMFQTTTTTTSDNKEEEEEEEHPIQYFIRSTVSASLLAIKDSFSKEEWSQILEKHLFFGYVRDQSYIHCKLFIVDSETLILSTSSILDGCLSRPTQRVGLVLWKEKDSVLQISQKLLSHLVRTKEDPKLSFGLFWSFVLQDANEENPHKPRHTYIENIYCKIQKKYKSVARFLNYVPVKDAFFSQSKSIK